MPADDDPNTWKDAVNGGLLVDALDAPSIQPKSWSSNIVNDSSWTNYEFMLDAAILNDRPHIKYTSADLIEATRSASLESVNLTIEGWVRFNDFPIHISNASSGLFLSSGGLGFTGGGWAVDVYDDDASPTKNDGTYKFRIVINEDSGQPGAEVVGTKGKGTTSLQRNIWYHLAYQWDGTNIILYVNGVKELDVAGDVAGDINYSGGALKMRMGIAGGNGHEGDIGPVRVSDIVRYTANFTPTRNWVIDSNTLGQWNVDERGDPAVADTVQDNSGNGHGMLFVGPPEWGGGEIIFDYYIDDIADTYIRIKFRLGDYKVLRSWFVNTVETPGTAVAMAFPPAYDDPVRLSVLALEDLVNPATIIRVTQDMEHIINESYSGAPTVHSGSVKLSFSDIKLRMNEVKVLEVTP